MAVPRTPHPPGGLLRPLLSLLIRCFLPAACPACGRDLPSGEPPPVCGRCWSAMRRAPPLASPAGLDRICAASLFESPLRELVLALKYRGKSFLGVPLGRWLAARAPAWARSADLVVAVPAPYGRRVRRGYHPAELIAAGVAGALGVPVAAGLLARRHGHPSQTELDRRSRGENARRSFTAGRRVENAAGKRILIIDDVSTTGATLSACAAILRKAGARRVDGLVLAHEALGAGGKRSGFAFRSSVLDGAFG